MSRIRITEETLYTIDELDESAREKAANDYCDFLGTIDPDTYERLFSFAPDEAREYCFEEIRANDCEFHADGRIA